MVGCLLRRTPGYDSPAPPERLNSGTASPANFAAAKQPIGYRCPGGIPTAFPRWSTSLEPKPQPGVEPGTLNNLPSRW